LVAFACLIEVQNAVNHDSYRYTEDAAVAAGLRDHGYEPEEVLDLFDISRATQDARIQRVYSRGRILAAVMATFDRITLIDEHGKHLDGWESIYIPSLAWFICALKDYHTQSSAVYNNEDDDDNDSEEGVERDHDDNNPPR
jgi:hypothetical protein